MTQSYRNSRTGFLTDILVDTTPIGAIVPNLKTGQNSYDHSFIKFNATNYPALTDTAGNAYQFGDDPAYTHEGYLYCDGSEYNISDYPALFEIIGNDYGGRSSSGIDLTSGGSGYTSVPDVYIDPPPAGPLTVQATAVANIDVQSGTVISIDVINGGVGYDIDNPPRVIINSTSGSSIYQSIGLESWTSVHKAPILFTQALDDDAGGNNQATWMQAYVNAVQAIPANAAATLTTVNTGGHSAFTSDATLQAAIRSAVGSTNPSGTITNAQFVITPSDGQTHTISGTSYPVMGKLYVPVGLSESSVDVVVVFHGTVSSGDIQAASETALTQFLNTNGLNVRDKIIFSAAYPQDHIPQSDQYNLTGVGTQQSDFLMGDNLPYARAAVGWVKNSLNAYIAAQGGSKTIGDVYLFGHSQGGKLVTKINTIDPGIAGVVANAPGPIQFDQTCTANPGNYSCSKVSAIHGVASGSGGGTGATAIARIGSNGSIQGINKNNVMEYWGDPNMGTFKVPDTIAKKIVGNSSVYGSNSPNIGNSTLGVGTTGGAWYFDQNQQDDYFSLGRITTTGYDQVIETTGVDIIGNQTVTITMRETKLNGVPQHNHSVYHSIPGQSIYIAESSGDRYLQDYRLGSGRLTRWFPTTGQVFTHKHGLLRQPNTDNTVATYDVLDYSGGAGGNGTIKDPTVPVTEQYYLASGEQGAGTYEFQTYVPQPISLILTGASVIGGRTINTGGTPIYDFTDEWTFNTPGGPYSINLGNITGGTPDNLIIEAVGGGGSGAAGTRGGNDGGNTIVKVADGSKVWLTAEGGGGGGATSGLSGGAGGSGGTVSNAGSENFPGFPGIDGGPGTNGVEGNGWPAVDYPNNPNGGGYGLQTVYTPRGDSTAGINSFVGGQSGTYNESKSSDGSFNFSSVGNPTSVTFTIKGAKGGGARGGYSGASGGSLTVQLKTNQLATFKSYVWSVELGNSGSSGTSNGNSPPAGGTASHSGNGGRGGSGYNDADGGSGGAASLLKRGTLIVAGAGGGGGAGATGYDGGAGTNGSGPPVGLQATTSALGAGAGGTGGAYGCVGGGGGGGGGGVARNGLTFGGSGNGGASGGPGGGPGADGGHGGGGGGLSGVSSYRSDFFSSGNLGNHNGSGEASVSVSYNDDYWTPGGGGGGSAGAFQGSIEWSKLDDPGSIQVWVGSGGNGVSMGGSTTGTTSNGGDGYVRVGLGKIIGYEGGFTSTTVGDVIASGSQDATVWDVNIYGNGDGTGSSGNFKLPTTQVPDVYIVGDGTGATATASVSGGRVNALNLTNAGGGFTEIPYVYVMNGAGSVAVGAATIDPAAGTIATFQLIPGTSQTYTNYVKFGGSSASNPTRFITTIPVNAEDGQYFSIKCCRGNGVNGGNVPEEVLRAYYRLEGTTTWVLLDTIVNPNATRNDPIIGNVPPISQAWDGTSGNTKWYTYSVALPTQARAQNVQFKIEQPRASSNAANDNDQDTDHYGIAEFIIWNEKVTELVFVPSPGAISKPLVDSLSYTIQGETGPGITYSSGLGASDATLTLKSTTKIEPQGVIDPDYHIPMLHPYRLCKYLIKAF